MVRAAAVAVFVAFVAVFAGKGDAVLPDAPTNFQFTMTASGGYGTREVYASADKFHEKIDIVVPGFYTQQTNFYTMDGSTADPKSFQTDLSGNVCAALTPAVWPPQLLPGTWGDKSTTTVACEGSSGAQCDTYEGTLYTFPATAYFVAGTNEPHHVFLNAVIVTATLTVSGWSTSEPSAANLDPPAVCFPSYVSSSDNNGGDAFTSSSNDNGDDDFVSSSSSNNGGDDGYVSSSSNNNGGGDEDFFSSSSSLAEQTTNVYLPELPCAVHGKLLGELLIGGNVMANRVDEVWVDAGNARTDNYFSGFAIMGVASTNATSVHRYDLNKTWTYNHVSKTCEVDPDDSFVALPVEDNGEWNLTENVEFNGQNCDQYTAYVEYTSVTPLLNLFYLHGTNILVGGNGTAQVDTGLTIITLELNLTVLAWKSGESLDKQLFVPSTECPDPPAGPPAELGPIAAALCYDGDDDVSSTNSGGGGGGGGETPNSDDGVNAAVAHSASLGLVLISATSARLL